MDWKLSRKGVKEEIMDEIPAECPICKSNDYDLDAEAVQDQIFSLRFMLFIFNISKMTHPNFVLSQNFV